jgi:hypothetical protein
VSAPTISVHPASQTIQEGLTATFTVTAAGTAPLAYQWKRGGVAIVGATAASYTTAVLTSADDGALFTVVVSNADGSATSTAATLTVAFSRREAILLALVAALTSPAAGITKPTGLTVHRYPMVPIEEDALPAMAVYWTECAPAEKGTFLHAPDEDRLLEYHLTVRVECRVTGEPVDQKLDALCQYARRVVFRDPSLGGEAWGAREDGVRVDALDKGGLVFGGAACDLVFTYFESAFDYPGDPALGGNLIQASYPSHPTEMTLEVNAP